MGKLKFTFTNIFTWVGIIATALLLENIGFLTNSADGKLSEGYYYLIFTIALLSFFAVFVFERRYNKTKIDKFLLLGLILFLGINLVAIWTFKEMHFENPEFGSRDVSYALGDKIRFSLSMFLFCFAIYSFCYIYAGNIITPRNFGKFYVIAMLIIVAISIYSIVVEIDEYRAIFNGSERSAQIKSLFLNENMFAGILILGTGISMLLNLYRKNIFSYLCLFLFFFEIIMAGSVIAMIIEAALIFFYFLLESCLFFKKSFRKGIMRLTIYMFLMVLVVLIYCLGQTNTMGFLSHVVMHIRNAITSINYGTFSDRTRLWAGCIDLLTQNPINLVFGYGRGISADLINAYSINWQLNGTIRSAHNGAMEIFLNFGIAGSLLYVLFMIYFFYCVIKYSKKNARYSLITLLVSLGILAYSFGESCFPFLPTVQSLLIGAFFFLPLILKAKLIKHKEIINDLKNYNLQKLRLTFDGKNIIFTFVLLSLVVMGAPLLGLEVVRNNAVIYEYLLVVLVILLSLGITLPFINYFMNKGVSRRVFYRRSIIFYVLLSLSLGASLFMYFYNFNEMVLHYAVPSAIFIGFLLLSFVVFASIAAEERGKSNLSLRYILFNICLPFIVSISSMTLVNIYIEPLFGGELIYIMSMCLSLLVYIFLGFYIPSKENNALLRCFSVATLRASKRNVIKDERSDALWAKVSK